MIWINIFIFIVLIVLQAFFSGIEIGFVTLFKTQILYKALEGNKKAKILFYFYKNPHRFFSTILVGINLVSVAIATLFGSFLIQLGVKNYEIYSPLILLPFITIFGESLPKLIFRNYANTLTFRSSYLLQLFYYLLFPFIYIFSGLSQLISKMFKVSDKTETIEQKELYIISNEILKSYKEENLILIKDDFFRLVQMKIGNVYVQTEIPFIHPNMSTQEAISLILKSKNKVGYVKKEGKYWGISLNRLLFANSVEDAIEEVYVAANQDKLGKTLSEFYNSDRDIILIVKDNEIINGMTKEYLAKYFFEQMK